MIDLRPPAPADHTALADLFIEMQAHYQVPCPSRAELVAAFAALPPGTEMLVARDDEALVGFAAFAAIFPGPGITSGFFLKELFVTKPARGRGIGRSLLKAVAALALARGHQRLDWTANRDDHSLVEFYKGLGAAAQEEKMFFRLSGDALRNIAG